MTPPTERRQNDTAIMEALTRIEHKFDEHTIRHEVWDKRLADHEEALFGKRDGTNGDRMGVCQKMGILWGTRKNAGDVLWKVIGGIGVAGALLIAGLK